MLTIPNSLHDYADLKFKFSNLLDGYQKMFDQSLSKSKDLGDMLRFLPGVVVQNPISMEAMVDLYRIKRDLLDRLVQSPIRPLKITIDYSYHYTLDEYLSGFLKDRDRSQLYYCDPILQHISICRHFMSLLDLSSDVSFKDYWEP